MELREYQQIARESIWREWDAGNRKTLLVLPTGCHAQGEQVLLASGEPTCVENIVKGDYLLGSDGTPRLVLETHTGHDMLYKVTPIKGTPFIVTGNHPITLVRTNLKSKPKFPSQLPDDTYLDVTVNEWLRWSEYKKHIYKLIRCSVVERFMTDSHVFTIDPYFLGILLGDGHLSNSIAVTTMDDEVVRRLQEVARSYGMHTRTEPAGQATTYLFVADDDSAIGAKGSRLHQDLKSLGLRGTKSGTKFVPEIYKTSPLSVRLELIAGLIDSDGSLTCGGYDFISKSERLANDLAFMCRSVGLAAYVSLSKKKAQNNFSGSYFRVSISGDCSKIPCKVARRQAPIRTQKKNVLRTGFSVDPIGQGQYFAFTVDGDHRYLLSDFTITHNTGKTVVFANVIADDVRQGGRALVLAHRGELLDQAADKLAQATGLGCSVEKAEQSCLGEWYRVVVGSVQSLMREKRLSQFPVDYFSSIVVDEAHHVLADSYQRVLGHFSEAKVLGVTATADRGDKRNLGQYFDSLAYEYSLPTAVRDGYLCKIEAQTIPLKLDLSSVAVQAGDFKVSDIDTALDPYLYQIADEMAAVGCMERKTVVFLPLIKTSQKFAQILSERGFKACEVNGESTDRAEVIEAFDAGRYNVLCNSMLLTEGWDCPSVDCIVVLRPTKIRSLYCQMVGRGTRIHPGKDSLLLLDFLWHTARHELCHPASLICESEEVAKKMTANLEAASEVGCPIDIELAEEQAQSDVVKEREDALAAQLKELQHRKRKLVDPLQYAMSIQADDLADYTPSFGWEMAPASDKQIAALDKFGIFSDEVKNAGYASLLLDRLHARRQEGFTTPKQIRFLEQKGFQHVGTWQFDQASSLITRIHANGWMVPNGINPSTYMPAPVKSKEVYVPWTREKVTIS